MRERVERVAKTNTRARRHLSPVTRRCPLLATPLLSRFTPKSTTSSHLSEGSGANGADAVAVQAQRGKLRVRMAEGMGQRDRPGIAQIRAEGFPIM